MERRIPFSSLRALLRFLLRRHRIESDLDEELRSHLANRADDLERRGLSRAEAERQSRVEFGGFQRYKEECRDTFGIRLFNELRADLRYALRSMRHNKAFTAVIVGCLALGIGANTAIFSVVNAVLLSELPVKNPQQLLLLAWLNKKPIPREVRGGGISYGNISLPYRFFEQASSNKNTLNRLGISGMLGYAPLGLQREMPMSLWTGILPWLPASWSPALIFTCLESSQSSAA